MLVSMTGFGRAEQTRNGITAVAEVRSVNNRYLEISCRLPRQLNAREVEVRQMVQRYVVRGSVSVVLEVRGSMPAERLLRMDVARTYYNALSELVRQLALEDSPRLEHLLRFSEIFEADEGQSELLWEPARAALEQALRRLRRMRIAEGRALTQDIRTRLRTVEQLVRKIARRGQQRIPEQQHRLRERVRQLLESEPDPQRLAMELVLLADRLDITEECVRLRSHVMLARQLLRAREPAGRKLNFLLQEMQREANTIGAKAADAQISQWVVLLKEELERIREQVQNVE
jgi:uncharacterized protein (TIGR00255 family)